MTVVQGHLAWIWDTALKVASVLLEIPALVAMRSRSSELVQVNGPFHKSGEKLSRTQHASLTLNRQIPTAMFVTGEKWDGFGRGHPIQAFSQQQAGGLKIAPSCCETSAKTPTGRGERERKKKARSSSSETCRLGPARIYTR